MTTGTIAGEDINGTISAYPSKKFNGIGRAGRIAGIGRSNRRGVSRV
jgi:hypothetical protein